MTLKLNENKKRGEAIEGLNKVEFFIEDRELKIDSNQNILDDEFIIKLINSLLEAHFIKLCYKGFWYTRTSEVRDVYGLSKMS